MTEFFFPENECGISNKVVKPVFEFVADCTIEPTPKPIFDCPLPVIQRDVEFPCPEFNVASKLNVGFESAADGEGPTDCPTNFLRFDIVKVIDPQCPSDQNKCKFDVNLEVDIAIPRAPCPVLKIGTFDVKAGFKEQPCVEDESKFEITTRRIPGIDCNDPDQCEFEIDLKVVVPIPKQPCPQINVNTFSVLSDYADNCDRGRNRFEITPRHRQSEACDDPGECNFDVDLEIYIPLPRPPCPEIRVNEFTVTAGIDAADENCPRPENKFEIRRVYEPAPCNDPTQKDKCEFEIDLQIHIPIPKTPCPTINITDFRVFGGNPGCRPIDFPTDPGESVFKIVTRKIPGDCNTQEKCEFDVVLLIDIPIPPVFCPIIDIKVFKVTSEYVDCQQGENRFVITPRHDDLNCNDNGQCNFDVELEINVPLPRPPCPEINVSVFDVRVGYATAGCDPPFPLIPKQPDACLNKNKFEINKRVTKKACGDPNNKQPETCEFDVELTIYIPPPKIPCPEINITRFKVTSAFEGTECSQAGDNLFGIVKRIIPCVFDPCDGSLVEPERCEFDIELEVNIPIPRTPCPDINVKKFEVKTGYTPCFKNGVDNHFRIIKREIKAADCTTPDQCEFDIDVSINIPIPVPPCPEINVTKFEVNTHRRNCQPPPEKKNRFAIIKKVVPAVNCNDAPRCQFELELEILVPVPPPPPCPEINVTTFEVTTYKKNCSPPADKRNRFAVIKKPVVPANCEDDTQCNFEIELEILIPVPPPPPCPDITSKIKVDYIEYDALQPPPDLSGCNQLSITKTENTSPCSESDDTTPPCTFEIDLQLCIPQPKVYCPEINVTTFYVNTYTDGFQPSRFTITPSITDRCIFDIDLEINVRVPGCPIIKPLQDEFPVTRTEGDEKLKVYVNKYETLNTCQFTFDFELLLNPTACPQFYTAGNLKITQIQPTEEPYGYLTFESLPLAKPTDPCEYNVYLDLYLPKVCKPTFIYNSGRSVINPCYYSDAATAASCPGTDKIEIYIEELDPVQCTYEVYTYYKPAIYRPPEVECDVFVTDDVEVHYLDDFNQEPYVELQITPRSRNNTDTYCTYDVTLDIYVGKCVPHFTQGYQNIDIQTIGPNEQPHGTVDIKIEDSGYGDCTYEITADIKIYIPSCQPVCAGEVIVMDSEGIEVGTGELECSGDPPDYYYITINLQTTECPTGAGGGGTSGQLRMLPTAALQAGTNTPVGTSGPTGPVTQSTKDFTPPANSSIAAKYLYDFDILSLWSNDKFVDSFVDQIGKNEKLRAAIKTLLNDGN